MSHQPFDSYIFEEALLTDDQKNALNQHLKDCPRCLALSQALNELEIVALHNPSPIPEPGFPQRWQTRLRAHQHAREIRNIWLMILALFTLAGLTILGIFLLNFFHLNWAYELTQLIAKTSLIIAQVRQFTQVIGTLTKNMPLLLPVMVIFIVGIFSAILMLTMTWLGTLVRLYLPINHKGNVS